MIPFVGFKCVLKRDAQKERNHSWMNQRTKGLFWSEVKISYGHIATILHLVKKYASHKIGLWWKTFHEWQVGQEKTKKKNISKMKNRCYVVKCLFKQDNHNKWCVTLCGLAMYIKKYLKGKEELRKLKYFTMQKYNLQKILWKWPKSFKIL
jgi:hypothetical protein